MSVIRGNYDVMTESSFFSRTC